MFGTRGMVFGGGVESSPSPAAAHYAAQQRWWAARALPLPASFFGRGGTWVYRVSLDGGVQQGAPYSMADDTPGVGWRVERQRHDDRGGGWTLVTCVWTPGPPSWESVVTVLREHCGRREV